MDKQAMQSVMEKLEHAAEDALQHDSSFFEALHALKNEIDNDPVVKSTIDELQAAGKRVFSSFVPRVKVRIRTDRGIVTRSKPPEFADSSHPEFGGALSLALRSAASSVIQNSRYCDELSVIVNEAVGASPFFEEIAADIEKEGHQVLICLDLSSYAQISESNLPREHPKPSNPGTFKLLRLSEKDRKFLKGVGIRTDESPTGAPDPTA